MKKCNSRIIIIKTCYTREHHNHNGEKLMTLHFTASAQATSYRMNLKFILLKLLPHLPGTSELIFVRFKLPNAVGPYPCMYHIPTQIAMFMVPTWGPPGTCRPQIGPMLAPWTLLSGLYYAHCPYMWIVANISTSPNPNSSMILLTSLEKTSPENTIPIFRLIFSGIFGGTKFSEIIIKMQIFHLKEWMLLKLFTSKFWYLFSVSKC